MMKFAKLLALPLVLVAATAFAQPPTKVSALYSRAYVPAGFDDNDSIQIVAEGTFKNSCYRPAETSVAIDLEKKRITLGPAAYEYSGFCLQVILPFDRAIDLGILPNGTYDIVQADGSKLGSLPVSKAFTDNADDHLYAPISQAFFRQKGAVSEIYITGQFPNSCMKLDEVKVTVEKTVIVVQPIAKVEQTRDCKDGKFQFEKLVKVEMIPAGRYLLHVRSMNAKAVNSLVDVK